MNVEDVLWFTIGVLMVNIGVFLLGVMKFYRRRDN